MERQSVFLDTTHLPTVYDYTPTGEVILEKETPVDKALTEQLASVWAANPPAPARKRKADTQEDSIKEDAGPEQENQDDQKVVDHENAPDAPLLSSTDLKGAMFNSFREAHTEVQYTMDLLNTLIDTQAALTARPRRVIIGNTPSPLPPKMLEAADAHPASETPNQALTTLKIRFGSKTRGLSEVHQNLSSGAAHLTTLLDQDAHFWSAALTIRAARWPLRSSIHPITGRRALFADYSLRDADSKWQEPGTTEIDRNARGKEATSLVHLPVSPHLLQGAMEVSSAGSQSSSTFAAPAASMHNGASIVDRLSNARLSLLHAEVYDRLMQDAASGVGLASAHADGHIKIPLSPSHCLTLCLGRTKGDGKQGTPAPSLEGCIAQASVLALSMRIRATHRQVQRTTRDALLHSSSGTTHRPGPSTNSSARIIDAVRPLRDAHRISHLLGLLRETVLEPAQSSGIRTTLLTTRGGSHLRISLDTHWAEIGADHAPSGEGWVCENGESDGPPRPSQRRTLLGDAEVVDALRETLQVVSGQRRSV